MPTGTKLVAAIMFAALGWWAAEVVRPTLPEALPGQQLLPVSLLVGALSGWRVMGRLAGKGYVHAVGYAISTLVTAAIWALVIFASAEMVRRSIRKFYDGPVEALESMVGLVVDYARLFLNPSVIGPVLLGMLFCAVVVEFVARRSG